MAITSIPSSPGTATITVTDQNTPPEALVQKPSVKPGQVDESATLQEAKKTQQGAPTDTIETGKPFSAAVSTAQLTSLLNLSAVDAPTMPAELAAVLEQLVAPLAAQVGDPKSMGASAAPQFTASVAFDGQGAVPLASVFSAETRASLFDLHQLVGSGQLKLPPELASQLDKRFLLACALPQQGGIERLLGQFSPAQQAALKSVAAQIGPVLAKYLGAAMKDLAAKAPNARTVDVSLDLSNIGSIDELPEALRGLLSSIVPGHLPFIDAVPGNTGETGGSQGAAREIGLGFAQADMVEAGPVAHEGVARLLADEVIIPDATVVEMERGASTLASLMLSNKDVDLESLVMIVMFEGSREASNDLKDQLNEMQKLNAQKKVTREYITKMKKQQAEMKAALRTEYDRRCGLPEGAPERITKDAPSFEDFCESQKLQMTDGSLDAGINGEPPSPSPSWAVSPNKTYYAQPTPPDTVWGGYTITADDRRIAGLLGIDAQQVMQLRRTWDNDPQLQVRMNGDFNELLVRSREDGGVGLSVPATDSQRAAVAAFLMSADPQLVCADVAPRYGLDETQTSELYEHWSKGLTLTERDAAGGTFENWLKSGAGPHLVTPDAGDNVTLMNDFLAGVESNEATAHIMTQYRIGSADARALQDLYEQLPASMKQGLGFDDWMHSQPPGGPGLVDNSRQNAGKLETWWLDTLTSLSSVHGGSSHGAHASTSPAPYSLFGRPEITFTEAINMAVNAGDAGVASNGQVQQLINQALERIPEPQRTAVRTELLDGIKTYLSRGNGGSANGSYAPDGHGTLEEIIAKAVAKAGPEYAAQATQYVQLAYTLFAAELIYTGTQNANSAKAGSFLQMQDILVQGPDIANDDNWVAGCGNTFSAGQYRDLGQGMQNQIPPELGNPPAEDDAHAAPADPFAGMTREEAAGARGVALRHLWNHDYDEVRYPPVPSDLSADRLLSADQSRLAVLEGMKEAAKHSLGGRARSDWNAVKDEYWRLKFRDMRDKGFPLPGASSHRESAELTSAQRSAMEALGTPSETGIHQPPQVEGLHEMTLGQLDAYISEWENKKDTLGDLSSEMSLKLQLYQERYSKFLSTLSNMMKKASDTSSGIVANLK